MRLHPETWFYVIVVLLGLFAANFWCWQPGIGPGRSEPHGTELEVYYGWPATHLAEWWRSEDPTLGRRLLESMPFYDFAPEMELRNRYFGLPAALANLAFAAAALCAVVIVTESAVRERLSRRALLALVIAAVVIVAVYVASASLSQHL
jgi:hypothetical protein